MEMVVENEQVTTQQNRKDLREECDVLSNKNITHLQSRDLLSQGKEKDGIVTHDNINSIRQTPSFEDGEEVASENGGSGDTYLNVEEENGAENENANRVHALQNEQLMLLVETEILTQKESAINKSLIKLFEETFDNLKEWNKELRSRENSLMEKCLSRSNIVSCDIMPEMTEEGQTDDGSCMTDDLLDDLERNQLLGASDLEKDREPGTGNEVEKESLCYSDAVEYDAEEDSDTILKQNTMAFDRQRLLNIGLTNTKIQNLYTQYCRAESFRKALAYQKSYLTMIANDPKQQFNNIPCRQRPSLKIGALAVLAIIRMKKLVQQYKGSLNLSTKYQRKRTPRKTTKKRIHDNISRTSDGETSEAHSLDDSSSENDPLLPFQVSICKRSLKNPHAKRKLSIPDSLNSSQSSGSYVVNETVLQNTDVEYDSILPNNNVMITCLSDDNVRRDGDIPRSYPRSSEAVNNLSPSTLTDVNAVPVSSNSPRYQNTSPFTQTPSSPRSCMTNESSSMENEFEDEDESLVFYMSTIEALQTKLKNVGFYKAPS